MKWFKHITDSHEDPDISDAWDIIGDSALTVFWVTLEVYAKEYSHCDKDGYLYLSVNYWERKLRRKWKKIEEVWNFFREKGRFFFEFSQNFGEFSQNFPKIYPKSQKVNSDSQKNSKKIVKIKVPKMVDLLDEYSKKNRDNIKTKSGQSLESVGTKEEEEDIDKENTNTMSHSPRCDDDLFSDSVLTDEKKMESEPTSTKKVKTAPDQSGIPKKGIEAKGRQAEVKRFIDFAFRTYQEKFGFPLSIDGGKDGKIVKTLLGTFSIESLETLWGKFLLLDDEWINNTGRSIGIFKLSVNKMTSGNGNNLSNNGRENNDGWY